MAQPDRIHSLTEKYLDGCCSSEELAELGNGLIADPEAAGHFAQSARLDALLEKSFQEKRFEIRFDTDLKGLPPGGTPLRRIGFVAAVMLLVAVVIGLVLWPSLPEQDSARTYSVVSGRVKVDGIETNTIPLESLFEVEGMVPAVIRLKGDSKARLEPATMASFRSGSTSPILQLTSGGGEFQARPGSSFRIETPAGSILAQDTEFRVAMQQTFPSGGPSMNSHVMLLLTIGVLAGQVEVQHQNQTSKLVAGEQRVFSPEKKPKFAGRIIDVSPDEKRLTLEGKPPKSNAPPPRLEIEITESTTLNYHGVFREGDRPTAGYQALALLDTDNPQRAIQIDFGNPVPDVSGRIVEVAEDAKSVTVEIYHKKGAPLRRRIELQDRTRIQYRDVDPNGKHPQVGYQADIWVEGETNRAIEARFREIRKGTGKPNSPSAKPVPKAKPPSSEFKNPTTKPGKSKPLTPAKSEQSPKEKPKKPIDPNSKKTTQKVPQPKPPSRLSSRDPLPVAAEIDKWIDQKLSDAKVAASPLADDAEFLRRVTLDIAGRSPTYDETLAFLNSNAPDKRKQLVDDLLERSSYGEHFAAIWHELIVPRSTGKPKTGRDAFAEWLADQFNQNQEWNDIVRDMLTIEGKIRENPQSGFLMANTENGEPQPNLIADATSRLFWGVQLRCAECHDHPFASWKQSDFWGTAAFFSRVRKGYTDGKNPTGWTLTEQPPDATERQSIPKELLATPEPGPVIRIPSGGGTQAGTLVRARFLGRDEVDWNDEGPFRPRFTDWAVGRDNPYFAPNAVNRLWSHFFGRGFVNPLDEFHEANPPSHPELLERLAAEFVASDYDLKHMVRCICNSRAYQRTSQPAGGNEADTALFSHRTIRVLRPEVLYDSLSVALYPPMPKGGQRGFVLIDRVNPIPNVSRDEFIRFFGTRADENQGSTVNQGIPQYLRLMNSSLLGENAPGLSRFTKIHLEPRELAKQLYLAVYSRYPSDEEHQRIAQYFEGSTDFQTAASGLFWALLNSAEFVLNH